MVLRRFFPSDEDKEINLEQRITKLKAKREKRRAIRRKKQLEDSYRGRRKSEYGVY